MRRLLGLIVLALCLAAPARAQDAATLKAAQDLAMLISKDSMQQISGAIFHQMWSPLEQQMGNKIDAATLGELRSEMERLTTEFALDAMKDTPQIYARRFSAVEIGDILAFYKTPTGAKLLRELPQIAAESAALMGPRMVPFQQKVVTSIDAIMKKHGYDK